MKNKNVYLLLGACALLLSSNVYAMGVGIAVTSIQPNISIPATTSVFVFPVEVSESIIVEPYASYKKYKEKELSGNDVDGNTIVYGIGVMSPFKIQENITTYFGLKVGKTISEINISTSSVSKDEYEVLSISPLVGFKYNLTSNMSVGMELGLTISDGDYIDGSNASMSSDVDVQEAYSALVVRYNFSGK